jgi:hypothetical protein
MLPLLLLLLPQERLAKYEAKVRDAVAADDLARTKPGASLNIDAANRWVGGGWVCVCGGGGVTSGGGLAGGGAGQRGQSQGAERLLSTA